MPVPSQLKQWHAEVNAVKRARPNLTHGEAMQLASQLRGGGVSSHTLGGKGNTHSLGGKKKKVVKRKAGEYNPHDLGGKKKVVKRKKGGNFWDVLGSIAPFAAALL